MQETQVQFLGWEDPLDKDMAAHSSILAWRIPWTEEPGGLQSMRLQRVGHDQATEQSQAYTSDFSHTVSLCEKLKHLCEILRSSNCSRRHYIRMRTFQIKAKTACSKPCSPRRDPGPAPGPGLPSPWLSCCPAVCAPGTHTGVSPLPTETHPTRPPRCHSLGAVCLGQDVCDKADKACF